MTPGEMVTPGCGSTGRPCSRPYCSASRNDAACTAPILPDRSTRTSAGVTPKCAVTTCGAQSTRSIGTQDDVSTSCSGTLGHSTIAASAQSASKAVARQKGGWPTLRLAVTRAMPPMLNSSRPGRLKRLAAGLFSHSLTESQQRNMGVKGEFSPDAQPRLPRMTVCAQRNSFLDPDPNDPSTRGGDLSGASAESPALAASSAKCGSSTRRS